MQVLVINCGSSTVKYRVVETEARRSLQDGVIEEVQTRDGGHAAAIGEALSKIAGLRIDAVGHRVVHGGPALSEPCLLDDAALAAIEACVPLAPLHNPANLAGIRAAKEALPAVPQVAVFDTAFHNRLPRRAQAYAIDAALAARHGIRRYGFHGTSHAYVAGLAAQHLRRPLSQLRLITCHLGSGASVCAIEFGHSVETSMGMTPLEGLVMGTRSGDLDPGVVLSLVRSEGVDAVDDLLNRGSGLRGLSGIGSDLREIEGAAADGHDGARLALTVFAHRVRKYIGAYVAVMGGIDAIVMTGGIGQNSVSMRRRILQRLEVMGVCLDEARNQDARVGHDQPVCELSAAHSPVRALAVATNEELMIALEAAKVVGGSLNVKSLAPIPIAISGRHVHLDRAAMDALFGEASQLTPHRPLSQPGQFAAAEKLTLVGPRGQIEGVRVLGPLRARPQVEVSRTDEFHLGVDAPIRASGQVVGSAPIVLIGPAGSLSLPEGLICAQRHIHMTEGDAAAYGVVDGDHVEVAVTGGPRDLTFGDVLVRVKDSYKLEMHIDTDEANAAELSRGALGDLVYEDAAAGVSAQIRSRQSLA